MRAAKPEISAALQRPQPALRRDCGLVENRMFVDLAVVQRSRLRRTCRIEGEEQRRGLWNALQAVHPVGDADGIALRSACAEIIPARPGRAAPRHKTRVRMQYRQIAAVAKGTEQSDLVR